MTTHIDTHICKHYAGGIGHIEACGDAEGTYRVSFYGRRVVQQWFPTMGEARKALRSLAAQFSR